MSRHVRGDERFLSLPQIDFTMSSSEICSKELFTGRNTHAQTFLISGLLISWCMAHD